MYLLHLPCVFIKMFRKYGIFCKLSALLSRTTFFIVKALYSGGRDWLVLVFRMLNLIVL